MKEELDRGFINVFSWRATGFKRQAKHELNFFYKMYRKNLPLDG